MVTHKYDLNKSGTDSLYSLTQRMVKSGEWNLDDYVEYYRGKTKVFTEPQSVRFHFTHRVNDCGNYVEYP